MTKKEAFLIIDILRSHSAANIHLDLMTLGDEFKRIIDWAGMWKSVFYQADYDQLADLLYLSVIERAI